MSLPNPAISLDQWRTLLSVVENGGIAAAADELGSSHSAVSFALARMQESLQLTLVRVEGRQATLTEDGLQLAQQARELLNEAQAMEELAANLRRGWEAEIRIAFDSAFPLATLNQALRNFAPLSRGARVRLREVGSSTAEAALRTGSIDLMICERVPDGYLGEPLASVELLAVAASQHPLSSNGAAIGPRDLVRAMQIEVRDAPQPQMSSARATQRWLVTGYDTAVQLVSQGHGYAWLPVHRVQAAIDAGELRRLHLTDDHAVNVTMNLVLADPKQTGPATRKLAEILHAHARAL
ncbi:MAG: LysR family transcriptional regulator [Pseudomonadota bacterium]